MLVEFKKKGNKVIAVLISSIGEDFMEARFIYNLRCILFEMQYGRKPCIITGINDLNDSGHAIVRCNKSTQKLILECINKHVNKEVDDIAGCLNKVRGEKCKRREWNDYVSVYESNNQLKGLSCYGFGRFDMYTGPSLDNKASWGEYYMEIENLLNK